jgi:hypothetical protein
MCPTPSSPSRTAASARISASIRSGWRAPRENMHGRRHVVQGGSTLTQQLAKNLFLEPNRTFERKMQEAMLALYLESRYSKDQILTLYLNRVYFGAGVYGIEAAAERFFGKHARNSPCPRPRCWRAASRRRPLQSPRRYRRLDAARQSRAAGDGRGGLHRRSDARRRRRRGRASCAAAARPARAISPTGCWRIWAISATPRAGDRGNQFDLDPADGRARGDARAWRGGRRAACEPGGAGGDDAGRRGARHGRRPIL